MLVLRRPHIYVFMHLEITYHNFFNTQISILVILIAQLLFNLVVINRNLFSQLYWYKCIIRF